VQYSQPAPEGDDFGMDFEDETRLQPRSRLPRSREAGRSWWHVVRVSDAPVMMFHFPAVELHHEPAGMEEAFVIRLAMIALAVE
jgi:hypothetical protein